MPDGWERARELRRELKTEWARLWQTKYDDQVRAEDVSSREFHRLFVDRGEIIYATRDYKPLSFREILERHIGAETAGRAFPDPEVGGWRKFVKEHIKKIGPEERREQHKVKPDLAQQQRKGGHGWRNKSRVWKKTRPNGIVD